jgi:hypothetical protein
MSPTKKKEVYHGSRRDQNLFDTDLTLLQDGERVSFAERVCIY